MTTSVTHTNSSLLHFWNLELVLKDEGLFSSLPVTVVLPTSTPHSVVTPLTASTFTPRPVIFPPARLSPVTTISPTPTVTGDKAIAPVLSVSASGKNSTSTSNSSLSQNTPKAVTGNLITSPAPTVAALTAPIPLAIALQKVS